MKALRLHGSGETLRLEQVPDPKPDPAEVIVQVAAAGMCGHDHADRHGLTRPPRGLPITLGHEVAGTVVAIGERVLGFEVGDRVACKQASSCGTCAYCRSGRESFCPDREVNYGGWAELYAVNHSALLKVPDGVDLVEASVVACVVGTTLNALRRVAGVTRDETVLVTGAGGGLGVHGLQVAKALGARAVALTSSPEKATRLMELGADDVVLAEGDEYWQSILAVTDGGPDVVLDNVGHPDVFRPCFRSLRRGGRYVFTGQLDRHRVEFYPALLFGKEATLAGSGAGRMLEFSDALGLVASGRVRPVVQRFALDDGIEAARLQDANQIFGRAVLIP